MHTSLLITIDVRNSFYSAHFSNIAAWQSVMEELLSLSVMVGRYGRGLQFDAECVRAALLVRDAWYL